MASALLMADRLIDNLRAENEALRALAQSRGDDAATLRQALRTCVHVLHDELIKRRKAEASHTRLVEEFREYRARIRGREHRAAA